MMSNIPVFSIIVPVYKVEEYLNECIDSILKQSFVDYEIILVDDGSPDNCPQICDKYAESSLRIKVVHKMNGGLSDARNAGIVAACGQYLLFCDSDDCWIDDDMLKKAYQCIFDNGRPDVILFSGRKFFADTGKIVYDAKLDLQIVNNSSFHDVLSYLVDSGTYSMSACTKILHREFLITNNLYFTKGLLGEDLDWFIGVMLSAVNVKAIDSYNYHYRIRNGSITQTIKLKNIKDFLWILNRWTPLLMRNEEMNAPLLGVLAYAYMTNMMHLMALNTTERKTIFNNYRDYRFLLKFSKNIRVKLVRLTSGIFGIKITGRLLSLYYHKLQQQ